MRAHDTQRMRKCGSVEKAGVIYNAKLCFSFEEIFHKDRFAEYLQRFDSEFFWNEI
jgi:hypothetical protein